jgi:DNA-binding GntR family transcriptional regulator
MQSTVGVLEPIQRPGLVDDVYARLRNAILLGVLPPGERLVEEQLAARLGVSRAPVRDALRALELDGLIMGVGRRGKVVSTLSTDDAWEVYSLRSTLEAMGMRLAIEHGTDELYAELEELVTEMRRAVAAADLARLSALDVRFHEAVCRASGHRRLLGAWRGMSNQIRLLSQQVIDTQYADLADVPERHARLIRSLRTGDPATAETDIRDHIDVVARRVIKTLTERDAERAQAVRAAQMPLGTSIAETAYRAPELVLPMQDLARVSDGGGDG